MKELIPRGRFQILVSGLLGAVTVGLLLYLMLSPGGPTTRRDTALTRCTLGALDQEHSLLRPVPKSFYSVDALNPDVVAYGGKYLMYFSGNSLPSTMKPQWVTGLAIASHPAGPFTVDPRFRGNYLNGGTTQWHGRLWHLVEVVQGSTSELAESADGRTWHHVAWLPRFHAGGSLVNGADFSLTVEHGELVAAMFLVHPQPLYSAFSLARVRFNGQRWQDFETVLRRRTSVPYEAYDVGEPYVFDASDGQSAMLYAATAANRVRSIAMALYRTGSWMRCSDNPVIRPGAIFARTTAFDPSVLRIGSMTYVYYGGAADPGLGSDLAGEIGVASFSNRD